MERQYGKRCLGFGFPGYMNRPQIGLDRKEWFSRIWALKLVVASERGFNIKL